MVFDFTLIIILALLGGLVARKFHQPLIVGYLSAGVIGSLLFSRYIHDSLSIQTIANLGVALLLFTVGLELNFTHFSRVVKIALVVASVQMVSVTIVLRLIFPLLGLSGFNALFAAIVFSLSSTAVVVKLLSDRGMHETFTGFFMTGWLLIQDLAVIPILMILPIASNISKNIFSLDILFTLTIGSVYVVVLFVLGKRVVPKIFEKISKFNSHELLLLSVVTFCICTALFTEYIGLSFSIGAFFAGLLVSETTENHEIFTQIRPLRNLFSSIFFVSLPFLISFDGILTFIPIVLIITTVVIAVKIILSFISARMAGIHIKVAFFACIGLMQVGEFSFIIANEGLSAGVISEYTYTLILLVTITTLIISPVLFASIPRLYRIFRPRLSMKIPMIFPNLSSRASTLDDEFKDNLPLRNHVVLCGFGRMGKYIGRALDYTHTPYIVIEIDRFIASDLKKSGIPVIYGDPSERGILDFAQVDYAKLIIVAVPDIDSQRAIITNARTLNKNITIITRSHFESDQHHLKALGADVIIQPEFSASLEVVVRTLRLYGFDDNTISGKIARLKIEHGIVI